MKLDTEHFKKMLEDEAQVVEKELGTVGRKNVTRYPDWEATKPDDDRDRADETEVADDIEQLESNSAVLEQLKIRLNEVKSALQKIEKGTYGICEISGEPIELDRLEANPAATTCKTHMNQ